MTDRDRTAAENESASIRIAAEREGLHVAVSVADEGRGIAPDHLGQLFRKYTAAGDRSKEPADRGSLDPIAAVMTLPYDMGNAGDLL